MTAEVASRAAVDATLPDDLAALPAAQKLRLACFRLFSRLLQEPPSVELLTQLRDARLVEQLVELAEETSVPAAPPLRALADFLGSASADALAGVRLEFTRLFLAVKHLPAPPWESVYRSADGLVNQQPARDALGAYADAGVTFDGWRELPADHVALELAFAATLIGDSARDPVAQQRLDRFELEHLASWVPRFCADLARAAEAPVYSSIATALPALLRQAAEA